jgi:alkanesulfonate monooxygenase SsuD/methylene tetrahydromethanopterin reductase-like flavin-dependent oxidoreductase (luciferase family)
MRYGIDITNFGEYGEARAVAQLAQAAEAAGWEALFVWDHVAFAWGQACGDAWTILTAVAAATERLTLGTSVTPLPRYVPHTLAHRLATLDRLSGGRVVLGVGLGGGAEASKFGETDDMRARAEQVDEGLVVLDRLWSGEQVSHRGPRYTVDGVRLRPLPLQRPRIPVWIGGDSRAALRRAARWDGWLPAGTDHEGRVTATPEQVANRLAYLKQHRTSSAPFEVALIGQSVPGDRRALRAEYEAAGVTLWLEILHGYRGTFDEMLAVAASGPPR